MELHRRVALVTGGNRGIGAGIVLALAGQGADVAIHYHRDRRSAEQTANQVRALGRRAEIYRAEIGDFAEVQPMVEAVLRDFDKVDILVNNAGNMSRGQSVADTAPEEPQRLIQTHALGSFYTCKLLTPQMRTLPRGDIVFISSTATSHFRAFGAPYNMAKAAVEALAHTLAKEEQRHNIRVNVVAPGLVETEMGRRLARAVAGVDDLKELAPKLPFGILCQPQDVGNLVAFLVSEHGRYISDQVIYLDGGDPYSRIRAPQL